jgi:hypothetical protein
LLRYRLQSPCSPRFTNVTAYLALQRPSGDDVADATGSIAGANVMLELTDVVAGEFLVRVSIYYLGGPDRAGRELADNLTRPYQLTIAQ